MAEIPRIYNGKPLTHAWPYRDAYGEPLGVVGRYDDGEGRKDVVPHFRSNGDGWSAGGPEEPAPLFGLDVLSANPDRPALVVEGEKCAAALQSLGLVAVTSPGGSNAAHKADWKPLEGRSKVYLMSDNDNPGTAYMQDVAGALAALESPPELLIVDLPNLPAKGDVVNFLQALCPDWDGYAPIPEGERERLVGELMKHGRKARPVPPERRSGEGEYWPELLPLPEPGEVGEAPPFPIAALPDALRRAAQEVARFVKVDEAAPALVGLSCIATAIGKRAVVVERKGVVVRALRASRLTVFRAHGLTLHTRY